jgi:uroporphyrinogen decarboxylase
LQGNLDPAVLFAGSAAIESEVRRIAHEADEAITLGAIGHIFNLGHGVLPNTDPTVITETVKLVHSLPSPL